jgi:methionyl-tRNA formyltransferase
MRVVFMGTPEFALPSLRALKESGEEIPLVVSQPDRPSGRGLETVPTPVKRLAESWGVPVVQPQKMKDPAFLETLARAGPDLIVVAAFGRILPPSVLNLPPQGCFNVHASLLPKYRGAAPIARAILNGEAETGISTMKMDEGLDTGDVCLQEKIPIEPEDTAGTVSKKLSELGARVLLRTIVEMKAGRLKPVPQDASRATLAPPLEKEEGLLDWTHTAVSLANRVRAMDPWPGAFTFYKAERWRIWRAGAEEAAGGVPGRVSEVRRDSIAVTAGTGRLRIMEIQPENRRRMTMKEYLTGHPVAVGEVLTQRPDGILK